MTPSSLGSACDRVQSAWFVAAPATRLAAVRILVGGFALIYLGARAPNLLSYAHFAPAQFHPVGVVAFLNAPLPPLLVKLLVLFTAALAVPFVLGWRYRLTAPPYALALLGTLSYRHAWGMIFHTENLLVLHVMILALAPAADAWSLDSRRHAAKAAAAASDIAGESGRYGWPLRLMSTVVVIAYFLAGLAKLRYGEASWLWGDALRNHIALDNARKALLGASHSPFAAALLPHPNLFRLLALVTVAFELAAPFALLGRRFAAFWAAAIWTFHLAVLALMWIVFAYPLCGIAFAPFFPVERPLQNVVCQLQRLRRSRRPQGPRGS